MPSTSDLIFDSGSDWIEVGYNNLIGHVNLLQDYEIDLYFKLGDGWSMGWKSINGFELLTVGGGNGKFMNSINVSPYPDNGSPYAGSIYLVIDNFFYNYGYRSTIYSFADLVLQRDTVYNLKATYSKNFINYYLNGIQLFSIDWSDFKCTFYFKDEDIPSFCTFHNLSQDSESMVNIPIYAGRVSSNSDDSEAEDGYIRNVRIYNI